MFALFTRTWWVVALRGLCALLFGLAAIAWPEATLTILVTLFGIFALADGVLALAALFGGRRGELRWPLALQGVVSLLAGALALGWPAITAEALLVVIACWSILLGGLMIVAAVGLRKVLTDEWLLGLSGAVGLLFGASLLTYPAAGGQALAFLLGSYAIVEGALMLALSWRLRRAGQSHDLPAEQSRREGTQRPLA
jgi:uncharacterized membrane protein HdeD (DUF308 family)